MKTILGVSVATGSVKAVCLLGGRIQWVGVTEYAGLDGLSHAIADLGSECPLRPHSTRVVLDRSIVQLRTIHPAPPIGARSVARYVNLESPRLFRRNGKPRVTNARLLQVTDLGRVLWVAGAPSDLVCAVVEGCERGGLFLEGIGPAAEVLPVTVANAVSQNEITFASGNGSEVVSLDRGRVWRSRLVRGGHAGHTEWAVPLARLNDQAPLYAAAFGAAVKVPSLTLLPEEARAARRRAGKRRVIAVAVLGLLLWLVAGGVYAGRLAGAARDAERGLAAIAAEVDSAVALRRQLLSARSALNSMEAAQHGRSRTLSLLAQITAALGDSAFLTSLRVSPDSELRLSGYAGSASSVLADLERLPGLGDVRFETPVTREVVGGGTDRPSWDRFSVVASWESRQ